MNAPTITDLREHLNLSAVTPELQRVLDASVGVVEGLGVGPLVARAFDERVSHGGGPVVVLHHAPVLSVESVVPLDDMGADGAAYNVVQFVVDGPAGVLTYLGPRLPYGWLRIRYTAGRAAGEVPADVHQAVLEQARHLWESQRGVAPGRLGDTVSGSQARGFTVPRRVEQLVAPHVTPSVAA